MLGPLEEDLKAYIFAMQMDGFPVTREAIYVKANKMYHTLQKEAGLTSGRSMENLSKSWLTRFLGRHQELTLRSAQVVKRLRTEVTIEQIQEFFINS